MPPLETSCDGELLSSVCGVDMACTCFTMAGTTDGRGRDQIPAWHCHYLPVSSTFTNRTSAYSLPL